MGRRKKHAAFDPARLSAMTVAEKLRLFEDFNELFHYELTQIPIEQLKTTRSGKAEDIAQQYYEEQGHEVYRSRVTDGYRVIGVEYYWSDHAGKVSDADRIKISRLKTLLGPQGFEELAYLVKDKSGTPDLLLIKDGQIRFIEVKYNHETVKFPTLYFWLKYGAKWPLSILRVVR